MLKGISNVKKIIGSHIFFVLVGCIAQTEVNYVKSGVSSRSHYPKFSPRTHSAEVSSRS